MNAFAANCSRSEAATYEFKATYKYSFWMKLVLRLVKTRCCMSFNNWGGDFLIYYKKIRGKIFITKVHEFKNQ